MCVMILKWRTSGQRGVWESPGELHPNCIPYPHPVIPIAHTGTLLSSWESVITLATPQSPLPETQYWLVILGTRDFLVLLSPLHLCFLSGATLHLLSLFNSKSVDPGTCFSTLCNLSGQPPLLTVTVLTTTRVLTSPKPVPAALTWS